MRPNVSLVSVIDEAKEMCIAYDKQRNATSQEIEARPSVGNGWEKQSAKDVLSLFFIYYFLFLVYSLRITSVVLRIVPKGVCTSPKYP